MLSLKNLNPIRLLKEAIFRRGIVAFSKEAAQVQADIYPEPSFPDMNKLLLGDPDVATSIEFISGVATGNGFEVTVNPVYQEKAKDQETGVERTAKEVIDQKCKQFGFDELAQEIASDIVGFGNSFIWKGNKEKFEKCVRILPSQITNISTRLDEKKDVKLKSVKLTDGTEISGEEIIWLSYNHIGNDPLGVGVLQALLSSLTLGGQTRPSFASIKAKVQKSMADQIENFSSYNEIWSFKGIPDNQVPIYNSKIQEMKKGKRLTTNVEAQIVQSIPERMKGLDFYVQILWDSFYLALKTPYAKLVLGGQFTEAAANAAISVNERKTAALQRFLKRVSETEFFDKWLEDEGLDPYQAQAKLHWRLLRMPDMSVLMSILTKLAEIGTLKNVEIRKILIDMGLPLDATMPLEPQTKTEAPKTAELPPLPDQPETSALKKHELTPREY
jgi:hypothetical protein